MQATNSSSVLLSRLRTTALVFFGVGVSAPSAFSGTSSGMVALPAGEFVMGAAVEAGGKDFAADARPQHRVRLDAFWMDRTDVTNAQFAAFVSATHYLTVAERIPLDEVAAHLPNEQVLPGSTVFSPPAEEVGRDDFHAWWHYVPGADWRHPQGQQSSIVGRDDFPVVQVTYEDAMAYARWAGKRLPTEAEWEYGARAGLTNRRFVWGDTLRVDGKWMANIFQGTFPSHDTGEDGYAGLAPVAEFPANRWGLYDMAGNVWQWCSDWYRADYYEQLARTGAIAVNPTGPSHGYDAAEPEIPKRVQRGGSFLCTDEYCGRFRVGSRGKGAPDTASNLLGFRCVMSRTPPNE